MAHANERRDWRIYADFAQVLIGQARALYAHEPFAADLDQTVYALDSTTIDLCLALFAWAPFQRSKAAVKLHTLLDLHGNIPTVVHITHGRISDVSQLDQLRLEPGAFYILDRGYVHFQRLYQFTLAASFFVIRARKNMQYRRRYSHTVDKTTGLRSDQTVILTGSDSSTDYPVPLRRVSFRDELHHRSLVFLTNNFLLPSLTVSQLYKARWQVELFFKWIKQHLHIKAFYGPFRQRREDPGLDRSVGLRPAGDSQKTERIGSQPLHNYTNPQPHDVRENPHFTGSPAIFSPA